MKKNQTPKPCEKNSHERTRFSIGKFTKRLLFFVMLLPTLTGSLYGQMNSWVMPPFRINATQSPVGTSALYTGAPTSGAYEVSNGAYDWNGNLMFYVLDFQIYSPTGAYVTNLGFSPNGVGAVRGGEVVIVPVPGECKKFYVIFSDGQDVVYTLVDCSSTTISVTKNNGWGFVVGQFQYEGTGLAASKKVASGSTFVYYLYMVNSGEVFYSTISSTGITTPNFLFSSTAIEAQYDLSTSSYYSCASTEVELSENGGFLAYNGIDTRPTANKYFSSDNVVVIELTNPTTVGSNWIYFGANERAIYGLEFLGAGQSPVLFIGGERSQSGTYIGFFEKFDFLNSNTTILYHANYKPKNTFLELTKNGKIGFVCDYYNSPNNYGNRYLVEYDDNNNSYTATQIDVTSLDIMPNGTSGGLLLNHYDNVFTLPDQIDGEDYNNFNTIPVMNLSSLLVNGTSASYTCGIFTQVYNCNPIYLESIINESTACSSQLVFTRYDENCNVLTGSGYFSLTTPQGAYSKKDDIRRYENSLGLSLGTSPGRYGVTLRLWDCCGRVSEKTVFIEVLQAINPVVNLEVYNYNNSQVYLPFSHNISQPNYVGASTIGFRCSGSTGNITEVNVVVDEISNTGSFISNIFNETKGTPGAQGLTLENLNTYCVSNSVWGFIPNTLPCSVVSPSNYSGYKSYFSGNNILVTGKYYRLTVILSNPCSSSLPEYTYLYVNNAYARTGLLTGIDETGIESNKVLVSPNPASDKLHLSFNNVKKEKFSVELYNTEGKKVAVLGNEFLFENGSDVISLEGANLADGVYIWRVFSESYSSKGSVIISKN